ncbi:nuclear transport factor 2 family protein [Burkholderia sp. Bp9126]|nr:nuclear transport factor 2 family protein [Burkholderia sp. Bp9126]
MMKKFVLAATLVMAMTSVHAGSSSVEAKQHFDAIGKGDISVLMRDYADFAQFNWVGGPLDGTYKGREAIRGVWEKFTRAQGPMKVSVSGLEEVANPKGASVTANVIFVGKQPIHVRYVLTYRNDKIASETWQIDAGSAANGY